MASYTERRRAGSKSQSLNVMVACDLIDIHKLRVRWSDNIDTADFTLGMFETNNGAVPLTLNQVSAGAADLTFGPDISGETTLTFGQFAPPPATYFFPQTIQITK